MIYGIPAGYFLILCLFSFFAFMLILAYFLPEKKETLIQKDFSTIQLKEAADYSERLCEHFIKSKILYIFRENHPDIEIHHDRIFVFDGKISIIMPNGFNRDLPKTEDMEILKSEIAKYIEEYRAFNFALLTIKYTNPHYHKAFKYKTVIF